MSALNWGIGDLLAVTKLAWDLYHNCYLVAREAPDDFRQLVNELASLQGVLRTLQDDVHSDKSFLERMGENRKETLERCLASCTDTLHKLHRLIIKYRELGVADGLQFWRKMKWVGKQGEIKELKSKIMVHTCNISLCMSSIGNSSLARIETSMIKALERQENAQETPDEDELAPLQRSKTTPTVAPSETSELDGLGIKRAFTGTTLVEPTATVSSDSTPSMSSEDASDIMDASPATQKHNRPRASTSTSRARKGSNMSIKRDPKDSPPSPILSDDVGSDTLKKPSRSHRLMSVGEASILTKSSRPQDVSEVVADAMKTLSIIKQKEQSARPLGIVRPDPKHQADEGLKQLFQQHVDDEREIRRLNARDWLKVATWWLLKAKYNMRLERPELTNTRASFSVSGRSRTPANQAYIDLLKAQWILHTIILREDNRPSLMTDENRKLFHTLSNGLREEFDEFEPVDEPDKDALLDQNHNIWEFLQPEEETFDDDHLLPGLENDRWIAVEEDDAGRDDETVIFRTFVNAAIGGKRSRVRSKGAPYLLVLSTKDGESEPKVTICNQIGTLVLSRDFTIDDLQERNVPSSPSAQMIEAIPLNFGRMNVSVAFTNEADLQTFMRIPRDYFNAVRRREPRQLSDRATETLLFKSSVEVYERLQASTMKPMNPKRQFKSCDLRVLETTTKEAWRTTRRLVISSSAAEDPPWCTELFLPLSRVQVSREGLARQAIVKWSDCSHEKHERTDGAYNPIYDYVYDDGNPNICLSLLFRNTAEAADFESTILKLSFPPVFTWTAGADARYVYNVSDSEPNVKHYKALVISHSRFKWQYSELFYLYGNTDFIYDHTALRIRLPQVCYTNYISTHVDKLYQATPDKPPHFSHCEKRVGNTQLDFDQEPLSQAFISSLTAGHELVFSRRAVYITTKPPSRFRTTKSNKGPSEIQLWRKANSMRLLSRWGDNVDDKWLTMAVGPSNLTPGRDTNRATLSNIESDRGRKIDMSKLVAVDPRDKKDSHKVGPITIAFETVRDCEEFVAALTGQEPRPVTQRSPLDQLLNAQIPQM